MHFAKGAVIPLVLLVAALAGCAGSSSDCNGFCIAAPSDPTQAYAFSAKVSADNYTWDFGDNLALAYGSDVQHTYDVANADLTVKLYAKSGAETRLYQQSILRGTGANTKGVFILEAQTNWVVTGERVRFSGAASFDPDGDALRFAWSCQKTGDAVRKTAHTHGNTLGVYKPPAAGSVTPYLANRTLPAATRSIDASLDLCAALGSVGSQALSTDASTIEGTFQQPGIYTLILIAADPAHPTASGQIDVVVTPPADRPPAKMTWPFAADFAAGTPGDTTSAQTVCELADPTKVCDVYEGAVVMPVGAIMSWVNFTYEADPTGTGMVPGPAQNQAKWQFLQDNQVKAEGGPAQGSTIIQSLQTPDAGSFVLRISAEQGGNFGFTITMESKLDQDPYKYY